MNQSLLLGIVVLIVLVIVLAFLQTDGVYVR